MRAETAERDILFLGVQLEEMSVIEEVREIVSRYEGLTVGVIGSHSAEEVGIAAKSAGLKLSLIHI